MAHTNLEEWEAIVEPIREYGDISHSKENQSSYTNVVKRQIRTTD